MSHAPDFEGVLRSLVEANVRFVLVGGLAMIAHGAANLTVDVDCLYARSPENIERIIEALRTVHPQLRTASQPVPIQWAPDFFRNVLNVTLSTDLGSLDLLAEAPGADDFEAVWERAEEMRLFGLPVRVASLEDLIRMKSSTGRPKDKEHAMQLKALQKLLGERG
jgi:predicted nucleotidyltransferase